MHKTIRTSLERLTVAQRRRTAPSLCFDAIPDGKPLRTFPGIALVIAGLCVSVQGCVSANPVAYSGLSSSAELAPNPRDDSGRVPYSYSTAVDWGKYSGVIVDPVVIYRGADGQFGKMSASDKASIAGYMQARFTERLKSRFVLAGKPGPNTLRVRLTLTGAKANTPVLGTLSRFDIAGGVYNTVQTARDREGSLTGSVIYAVEIFDAQTDRLLKAFVTKQYPSPINIKASMQPLAAAQAGIDKGADALVAQLK
ncbi:hypothetical protein B5V02_07025 [Mesorhizobium kowhaii]|uniref:DUF3313 domain-containing protein n=1 Tax=Mesorhizobium kowhaii TaxID=1300272 RepID=A0A2W7C9T2_9HYPH|nr:hypothetical protein B5V02_07025 [Mesorhizobium kowhaii]